MALSASMIGGSQVDMRRLHALILESLALCDLKEVQEAIEIYLKGPADRLVKKGIIDLSSIWGPLVKDATIPQEKAREVIVLISLYAEHTMGTRVYLPDSLRQAIETTAVEMRDVDARVVKLVSAVEERLRNVVPDAAPSRPAAASAPVKKSTPTPSRAFHSAQGRSAGISKGTAGMLAAVVIFGLTAYWVNELYFKQDRLSAQEARNLAMLASVIPLKRAQVDRDHGVLLVVLRDDRFSTLAQQEQIALGTRLIDAIHQPDIHRVQIISGKKFFVIKLDEAGATILLPPS